MHVRFKTRKSLLPPAVSHQTPGAKVLPAKPYYNENGEILTP